MPTERTIIVDRYVNAGKLPSAGDNQYKGLRIHALPGLHDFIGALAKTALRPAGRVIDLAAGSGAMSLRLQDLGLDVSATDYVGSAFMLRDSIPFQEADLNADFALHLGTGFDAIVASEIIEHLENPRHFCRQAFLMLKPGGRLLLSTPNIDSTASKVLFLTTGNFLWFTDQQYRSDGHISPISQWQLLKCLAEAGFQVVTQTSFGNAIDRLSGSPRLQLLARCFQWLLAGRQRVDGEIGVFVAERPNA